MYPHTKVQLIITHRGKQILILIDSLPNPTLHCRRIICIKTFSKILHYFLIIRIRNYQSNSTTFFGS
ncbi:hypothetical protein CXP47_24570 [Pseudomonas chlororaphis]|nr:hypothetical protein CXP47_24570 [Pseudomonas chlororaphis]